MVTIQTISQFAADRQPRRVMKYLLLYCSSGTATVVADELELELHPHDVTTITSGQVHYIKSLHRCEGIVLEFTLDFFCKTDHDIELIFQNGLFCHFAQNEVIKVNDHKMVELQLNTIAEELLSKPYQHLISIHSRIELILVGINRSKLQRGDEIWKPDALFLKFLELVRCNFEHNYPLRHFATLLSTTEARLNEQSKLHTGKTAQNVIYGLCISEARRLLTYQKLSVKEVAYSLGFSDPFYFSNFFKKHSGESPKSYQKRFAL